MAINGKMAASMLFRTFVAAALCFLSGIAAMAASAAAQAPANLGRGLGALVEEYRAELAQGRSEPDSFRGALAVSDHAQGDARGRVLVDVLLDGRAPLAQVSAQCAGMGGTVTATAAWYRKGLFSAWVPLSQIERLAAAQGVSAVHMAPQRRLRVGAVTTQGAVVHKSDLVNNMGYTGTGVTVGVLSDSYNDDHSDRKDHGWTNAQDDVDTGDLPGAGNPDGDTTPVNVIQDGNTPSTDSDEGRAMLQIVHDMAPGANLAFCTTGYTDAEMAANIQRLAQIGCQVICDDVGFDDEPMFSDGVIGQAIDTSATNGVAYFSAIGNDGNSGYEATFNPVSDTVGRKQAEAGGIQLSTIPSSETKAIYEWHGFGTGTNGNPIVVQNIQTGTASTTLIFQWNDPFDVTVGGSNAITTDYDILVFDSAGVFSSHLSGTEKNAKTNEPLELPVDNLRRYTSYKICIVLTNRIPGYQNPPATRLRYLATNDTDAITGDYITLANVSAYGHPCAAGCAGVGAYVYDIAPDPGSPNHFFTPMVDGYSSNGPVDIYFDNSGNLLPTPVTRNQPMFACTDNVDTTFFPPSRRLPNPYDYDMDGWPNFAGTSAAAPHAAGIAALLMNASAVNQTGTLSNLGTLSPQEIQNILIATTQGEIDEDPIFCSGSAGPVAIMDAGDGDSVPNIFQIVYGGTTGGQLSSITINLQPVSMHFDTGSANGTPFIVDKVTGKPRPTAGKRTYSGGSTGKSSLTLPFKNFNPGDTYSFLIGFDDDNTGLYGYDADELAGATFSVTITGTPTPYMGTFANQLGRTYNYKAGYGLLDAQAAVNMLLGQ